MNKVLLFAASLLTAVPALAADNTDARFQWSLDFGASRIDTSYGLSLTRGGTAATAAILGNNNSTSEAHTLQVQDNGSAVPINGDTHSGYTVCVSNAVPETCVPVSTPDGGS